MTTEHLKKIIGILAIRVLMSETYDYCASTFDSTCAAYPECITTRNDSSTWPIWHLPLSSVLCINLSVYCHFFTLLYLYVQRVRLETE